MLNGCVRVNVESNLFQQSRGAFVECAIIEQDAVASRQRVKKQILRDREVRQKIEFLVDHSDAGFEGVERGLWSVW